MKQKNFPKEDFLKFYFDNKDKKGFLSMKDLSNNFKIFRPKSFLYRHKCFDDLNTINFLKSVDSKKDIDAEMIMSRVYSKCGLDSAKYFPIIDKENCELFTASPSVFANNSVEVEEFNTPILNGGTNVILKSNMPNLMQDVNDSFTREGIREILLMRLLDVASFNNDRHIENFFYKTKEIDSIQKVVGVKTFDYGESGYIPDYPTRQNLGYFNNCKKEGIYLPNIKTKDFLDVYKHDEAVQFFLPKDEAGEILGNIDFKQEGADLKEEIGYNTNPILISAWQKSFYDIANKLEQ